MKWMHFPRTAEGRRISGITMIAMLAAMTGCGTMGLDPGVSADSYGVIVNTDSTKDLIGGVRRTTGESVYAYGRFTESGAVAEVTAAVLENASGQKATLYLESGWPRRAIGFDGSRLDIVYREVGTLRLRGELIYTPVGSAPQTATFDVDLQKTAEEIAALIQQLTGTQVTQQPPPELPEQAGADRTARADRRTNVQVFIVPVFIAVTGFTINLVMSQLLRDFLRTADALAEAAILTFLAPFILMGNLMRLAMGMPMVTIDYDADGAILNIPRPQTF